MTTASLARRLRAVKLDGVVVGLILLLFAIAAGSAVTGVVGPQAARACCSTRRHSGWEWSEISSRSLTASAGRPRAMRDRAWVAARAQANQPAHRRAGSRCCWCSRS